VWRAAARSVKQHREHLSVQLSSCSLIDNHRTHEDLEEKSHRQDRQIESLLNQFEKLRRDQKIKEWMDRAQSEGICPAGRVSKAHGKFLIWFLLLLLFWRCRPDSFVINITHHLHLDPRNHVDTSAALAVNSYFRTGEQITFLVVEHVLR
jgi:hypothetical protein